MIWLLVAGICITGAAAESVRITNQSMPKDLYNWLTTDLDGDDLSISISYEGDCEQHTFQLVWDGSLSAATPPQANLVLSHDNAGDTCDQFVSDTYAFDITPIRTRYQEQSPEATELTINFIDYDGEQHKFDYEFPARTGDGPEPIVCTMDAKLCPDGTSVGRDPDNDCEFPACPSADGPEPEDKTCASSTDCGSGRVCVEFPGSGPLCSDQEPCSYYECDEGNVCQEVDGDPIVVTCTTPEPDDPDEAPATDREPDTTEPAVPVVAAANGTAIAPTVETVISRTATGTADPDNDTGDGFEIVLDKKGNDTLVVGDIVFRNTANATLKDGKIIVSTGNGPREILPPPVTASADIELIVSQGRALYIVKTNRRARVLFLVPMNALIITTYDASTGMLVKTKLPWWSFLAKIDKA